ncbi:MAG TPA: hypothetical protein VG204_01490 [Terriglobia bacterium]|nr:hypothetical protein [Terriglobia bacterium]
MQAWTLPAMTLIAGLGLGILIAGWRFKATLTLYERFIAGRLDLQNSPLVRSRTPELQDLHHRDDARTGGFKVA